MMPPSSLPLFCQCAILLVSFEGVICPDSDNAAADAIRRHLVPFTDILLHTIYQEGNNSRMASFCVRGAPNANYNIKFTTEKQARYFATFKDLPPNYRISWARIYWYWRTVNVAYNNLHNNDAGFKVLESRHYPNLHERLYHLPYVFKRSEIENTIRTSLPHTLYLRNKTRAEDYMIMFRCTHDLGTFLKLFPDRIYDDRNTTGYYFMRPI